MARVMKQCGEGSMSNATAKVVIAPAVASEGCVLAGLSLAMLLPSLATSIANAALPALAQTFGISFHAAQWIVLSYLLSVTALTIVAGRMGDIVGRRGLLLIGIAMFTLGSLLCAAAPTFALLIAARAI